MSWGYKITIVYLAFAAGIAAMVIKSYSQNIDLVTPDYYAQELKHQQKIDAVKRTNALPSKLSYEISKGKLGITLPAEFDSTETIASVLLYCPADKSKDIKKGFTTNNRKIVFDLPATAKGNYELQVNWVAKGSEYYFEEKLFL